MEAMSLYPHPKTNISTVIPKNYKLEYANTWTQTIVIKRKKEESTSLPGMQETKTVNSLSIRIEDSRNELLQGKGKLLTTLKDLR